MFPRNDCNGSGGISSQHIRRTLFYIFGAHIHICEDNISKLLIGQNIGSIYCIAMSIRFQQLTS